MSLIGRVRVTIGELLLTDLALDGNETLSGVSLSPETISQGEALVTPFSLLYYYRHQNLVHHEMEHEAVLE